MVLGDRELEDGERSGASKAESSPEGCNDDMVGSSTRGEAHAACGDQGGTSMDESPHCRLDADLEGALA